MAALLWWAWLGAGGFAALACFSADYYRRQALEQRERAQLWKQIANREQAHAYGKEGCVLGCVTCGTRHLGPAPREPLLLQADDPARHHPFR